MNYKPNDQFVAAIRGLRLTMKFLGTWQQPGSPRWYKLVWYIQSVGIVYDTFGPIAGLIMNRQDASKTIDSLGLSIPVTTTLYHWIMFSVHGKTIGELLEFMEKDWINVDRNDFVSASVPDSKRIMKKYYRTARIFFVTVVSVMVFGAVASVHDSLEWMRQRDNGTEFERNSFPTPYSWYPVDLDRGYSYQIAYTAQAITASILPFIRGSIDNFFITVTLNLCAQFEILRHFTESITYDSSRPEYCEAQVRLMIRRHQELLEAAERLQKSYSSIIAAQYASVTLSICFLGYEMIAEIEKTDSSLAAVVKIGSFCAALLQLIFTYCLVSDQLTNQSVAIALAVYNCDWSQCPRSICLSFLITIARANRPVRISGANLIPMSLESFTDVMKASASYLSVLRAVGVTDG